MATSHPPASSVALERLSRRYDVIRMPSLETLCIRSLYLLNGKIDSKTNTDAFSSVKERLPLDLKSRLLDRSCDRMRHESNLNKYIFERKHDSREAAARETSLVSNVLAMCRMCESPSLRAYVRDQPLTEQMIRNVAKDLDVRFCTVATRCAETMYSCYDTPLIAWRAGGLCWLCFHLSSLMERFRMDPDDCVKSIQSDLLLQIFNYADTHNNRIESLWNETFPHDAWKLVYASAIVDMKRTQTTMSARVGDMVTALRECCIKCLCNRTHRASVVDRSTASRYPSELASTCMGPLFVVDDTIAPYINSLCLECASNMYSNRHPIALVSSTRIDQEEPPTITPMTTSTTTSAVTTPTTIQQCPHSRRRRRPNPKK